MMTKIDNSIHWYLAQLKPNCATLAERNLARQGFATFLPLERVTHRKGNRLAPATRPYFPGYLFVGIGAVSSPWRTIRSTHGVARLVQFGSSPAQVPFPVVSKLQQACDTQGCVVTHTAFTNGDDVRIAAGPFANFIGRVEQLSPTERVWVLFDVMGKATRVSIARRDLRKVG